MVSSNRNTTLLTRMRTHVTIGGFLPTIVSRIGSMPRYLLTVGQPTRSLRTRRDGFFLLLDFRRRRRERRVAACRVVIDHHRLAVTHVPFEELDAERRFNVTLDSALEWPRA